MKSTRFLSIMIMFFQACLFSVFSQSNEERLEMLLFEDIPMVITASKTAEAADIAPSTIYVITQEQIKKLGLRDIKEVLAIVPGMETFNNDFFLQGGQRGFVGPFSQSLILINGREVNNLIAGETFFSNQFRTSNVRQIEIIAGPGSALYGANAVGGVINIITKTPESIDGQFLSYSYGSFNTNELSLELGKVKGDFKISASVAYYKTDSEDFSDFLSDTSKVSPQAENNSYRHMPDEWGYDNESYALPVSVYLENKNFYVGAEYYQNQSGRGASSIQWDYTDSEDYRELFMKYIGYKREDLLDNTLSLKMEYRHTWDVFWGNHTEGSGPIENPVDGTSKTTDVTAEDVELYRGYYSNKDGDGATRSFAMIETVYQLMERSKIVSGIDYDLQDITGATWSRIEGEHPATTAAENRPEFKNYKWGLYAQDQTNFFDEKLIVTLGGRYVIHERYDSQFLPRCGLVYEPVKTSIFKFLYGKSFREPTVFELLNNSNINPMYMNTYEFGWHQYLGQNFKNEIVYYTNKAEDRIVSGNVTYITNGGELKSQGIEDTFTFKFEKIKGYINYTYMIKAETNDNGVTADILDIYEHKGNLVLMYDLTENFSGGFLVRYRGDVETEYYGDIYTLEDYALLDLAFNITKIGWMDADTSMDIIVKNVFDKEYYHPEPRDGNILQQLQESRALYVKFSTKI